MMALSSPWLTVGEAASFLRRTEREVLALIYAGELEGELRLDHYDVSRESVEAYGRRLDKADASELATRMGDVLAEHATRPVWTPWSGADYPDDRRDQEDA